MDENEQQTQSTQAGQSILDWVKEMLGDEQSELRSAFSPEQQILVQHFLEGTWQDMLVHELETIHGDEALVEELKNKYTEFVALLQQDEPPTLGVLINYVFNTIQETLPVVMEKLRQLLLTCIGLLYDLLMIVIESLNHLKLPGSVFPAWLFTLITQGRNINVLCLLLAMPLSTVKKLLDTPYDELKIWVAEASA